MKIKKMNCQKFKEKTKNHFLKTFKKHQPGCKAKLHDHTDVCKSCLNWSFREFLEWTRNQFKIQEIKEIINKNPKATFWAEGYCPAESIEDNLNDKGQYWTSWENLTADELIDKISDDSYTIEKWEQE